MSTGTIVVLSGGMDSAVVLADVARLGPVHAVSFNYGQRHARELDAARELAAYYGARHSVIDLADVGALVRSALTTDAIDVPDGHYEADSMRATVVANRNAIFLTIAFGVAVSEGAGTVAIGVHAGDHHIYPDCRPAFIRIFRQMERIALDGIADVTLHAPFLTMSKADIVRYGASLGVPFDLTYSCYKGGPAHCGTCGTCVERHEAFERAGLHDPTTYIQGAPA